MRISDWSSDVCSSDLVELPDQRPQPVAEFDDAADEILDLHTSLRQHLRGHDPFRRLGREDEPLRRLVAPPRVRRRLLGAVVGAVDLDRADVAAGVFQLATLHQPGWVEVVAPRHERPRSEEHTSELQSLMRISYAVICLTNNIKANHTII